MLESSRATSWCLHALLVVHLTQGSYSRSCFNSVPSLITCSAYGEAQGCPMQGQQCYCHLLTRYLIFENLLIVYGNILESMGVT